MFDLKKFIAFAGIEDSFMQQFYDVAESEGLNPTFDIYHILAGDEKPSEKEIKIMEGIYATEIKGTAFESAYNIADIDFQKNLTEKNRRRSGL
jgi:hypothetical protein